MKSKNIKKYDLIYRYNDEGKNYIIGERPDGRFVRYSDYMEVISILSKHIEELQTEISISIPI